MSETQSNIEVKSGSARGFGITFAAVFGIVGVWPALFGNDPRLWCFGIAAAFLAAAFLFPKVLETPNRWWFRFGMLLGAIVAPIVMGLVYLLVITPFGLVMRGFGKKLLKLDFEPDAETYWIRRTDEPSSMRNQF